MPSSKREVILEAARAAADDTAMRGALLELTDVWTQMDECPEQYTSEQVDEVAAEMKNARRRLKALRSTSSASSGSTKKPEPPAAFVCPITFELMDDPVVASDGHSYQRVAIEAWLDAHDTSPKTNVAMDKRLYPNFSLRAQIDEWKRVHAEALAQ